MTALPEALSQAKSLRRVGLVLIIAGAGLVLLSRYGGLAIPVLEAGGMAMMAGGWVTFAGSLYMKRRARQTAATTTKPERSE